MGRGSHGVNKLREEIEAENPGIEIPMAARWLGRLADIKEGVVQGQNRASSVTFVVRGEKMANRIIVAGRSLDPQDLTQRGLAE